MKVFLYTNTNFYNLNQINHSIFNLIIEDMNLFVNNIYLQTICYFSRLINKIQRNPQNGINTQQLHSLKPG